MEVWMSWALIIVSIMLIALVMLQTRGSGLGSIFGGGDAGVYKTRRGVEKTMFNMTIFVAGLFLLISLLTVILG